jgi:hypothetical protein
LAKKPSSFTDNIRQPYVVLFYTFKPLFVKPGFFPLLNSIVSNIAILFCFAPFLLLFLKKLQNKRVYALVGIYWLVAALLNQYYWLGNSENNQVQAQFMFARNLVGVHFVLVIFFFSFSGTKKRVVLYTMLLFVLFELMITILDGFTTNTGIVVIGLGSLIVLFFCLWGLTDYFRELEHSSFQNFIAFIYAAFLFAYGSATMIHVLNYLKVSTVNDPNEFFLYYVGLLLSSLLTCYGIWKYATKPSLLQSENY